VVLTEVGRQFQVRCHTVLAEAQNAIDEIAQINAHPSGIVRIAAPNDFGTRVIAPTGALPTAKGDSLCQPVGRTDARGETAAGERPPQLR
jgi:hypothetical protein